MSDSDDNKQEFEGYSENDEGILVDKDGNEPPKGSEPRRVNTVTRNWRTTERELEATRKQLDDDKAIMKQMGEHVQSLVGKVDELQRSGNTQKETDALNVIESELDAVEDEINTAIKDEDWGKVAGLQTKARRVERKLAKAQSTTINPDDIVNKVVEKVKPVTENKDSDTEAKMALRDFKRDRKWYSKDDRMKRYADNLSHELVATGKYNNYDDLMQAVGESTEKAFDYDGGGGNFNSVDGGSYGSPSNNDNGKEPTSEDKSMADKMGIPLKDWMKSKQIAGGRV